MLPRLFLLLAALLVGCAHERVAEVHEDFGPNFDAKKFLTPIPNKNTQVRDGALWTRGESGGKYPPMVYLGLEGKDLTVWFRYRHLGPDGWLWVFVDGDDGYGGTDHMLRIKLLRTSVTLEVDGHTFDPHHPLLQKNFAPIPVSGSLRTNEHLAPEKIDLKAAGVWHEVRIAFSGETVRLSVDGSVWTHTLTRANFNAAKKKLLWMQNGGAEGIEIDDVHVIPTP
jgi:hypothetical protein